MWNKFKIYLVQVFQQKNVLATININLRKLIFISQKSRSEFIQLGNQLVLLLNLLTLRVVQKEIEFLGLQETTLGLKIVPNDVIDQLFLIHLDQLLFHQLLSLEKSWNWLALLLTRPWVKKFFKHLENVLLQNSKCLDLRIDFFKNSMVILQMRSREITQGRTITQMNMLQVIKVGLTIKTELCQ